MDDNQIRQLINKYCDEYCDSVDCSNCGMCVDTIIKFVNEIVLRGI